MIPHVNPTENPFPPHLGHRGFHLKAESRSSCQDDEARKNRGYIGYIKQDNPRTRMPPPPPPPEVAIPLLGEPWKLVYNTCGQEVAAALFF